MGAVGSKTWLLCEFCGEPMEDSWKMGKRETLRADHSLRFSGLAFWQGDLSGTPLPFLYVSGLWEYPLISPLVPGFSEFKENCIFRLSWEHCLIKKKKHREGWTNPRSPPRWQKQSSNEGFSIPRALGLVPWNSHKSCHLCEGRACKDIPGC